MKNWKYIKVGNYDAQEKLGLKPVPKTIHVNEHDKKTILEIYEKAGRNYDRAKRMIKEKFIGFDDNAAKTALESVIGSNGKGLNESIYKQEASMFEGLKKDAEKEIGNKAIVLKDGNIWVVLYANETKSQEFESEAEAREFAKKVGNAETVSEYNAEIQRLTKKAEQLRRMGQGRSAMEIEKQIEKLGKEMREAVGNETKGERKFGKVMGEFEEGALKTPQGKTVTDPAQAKAIAYSEADKVDNLKRARNAMNKKVKNSSVREYKDSEGRIAQIDFNSDGTDADMSIYEDERMTRSVESKNFSTIRDAEQYVQSHGFRRVG